MKDISDTLLQRVHYKELHSTTIYLLTPCSPSWCDSVCVYYCMGKRKEEETELPCSPHDNANVLYTCVHASIMKFSLKGSTVALKFNKPRYVHAHMIN